MATKCYLDSNICISFIEKDHPFHKQAINLFITIRVNSFEPTISPLVLDETIHILTRNHRLSKTKDPVIQTQVDIKCLFATPNLKIVNPPVVTNQLLTTFDYMKKFHLKTRDAFHLLTCKYNQIKYFATFDTDFDSVFSSKYLKRFT